MKLREQATYILSVTFLMCIICICGCTYKNDNEIKDNFESTNSYKNIKTDECKESIMVPVSPSILNIENEEEFKSSCEELILKNVDEDIIGKYVTKELIFGGGTVQEDGHTLYKCGATEDFLEDLGVYQKTYNIYKIEDYRIQKDFPIEENDVMRIYGIVDDVSMSYQTGNYNPTIKIYYAEYIRRYGQKAEDAKNEEEIKKEREEVAKELEYKDSLNSDYTGTTKNIDNMDELPLTEYMTYCDNMNLQDVVNSNEDFTGRYVKLHIQVSEHKKFNNDEGKTKRLGKLKKNENVQDDVWFCMLYNERVDEYVYPKSEIDTLYFLNTESIDASALNKGDNLIVYGQFVAYDVENGKFEMIVRYFEKE